MEPTTPLQIAPANTAPTPTRRWLLIALGLGISFPAWANAGTPLMWATLSYLVFGNLVIGMGEGQLFTRLTGAREGRAVGTLIAANYFSAWIGLLLFGGMIANMPGITICNIRLWEWLMVLVSFAITVVLEWPFLIPFYLRQPRKWWPSFRMSLILQSASYAFIVLWFMSCSRVQFPPGTRVVRPADIGFPAGAVLYYLDRADGAVCRLPLDQSAPKACVLPARGKPYDALMAAEIVRGESYKLLAFPDSDSQVVCATIPASAASVWGGSSGRPVRGFAGAAADLRSEKEHQWTFRAGPLPLEGLCGYSPDKNERFRLVVEAPYWYWWVRSAIVLADDVVVFELGGNQICAYARPTGKLALLARGRSPVIFLERPPPPPVPG